MVKPKLGSKRQCPKCGARFYDLGKDDPITCISCEHQFPVEQILKSRRPPPPPPVAKAPEKAVAEKETDKDVDAGKDGDDDTDGKDDADGEDDDNDSNLGAVLEIDDDDDDPETGVKVEPNVDGTN